MLRYGGVVSEKEFIVFGYGPDRSVNRSYSDYFAGERQNVIPVNSFFRNIFIDGECKQKFLASFGENFDFLRDCKVF